MIEFESENRPICTPTTEAQCKLNWAALQDVWDAMACYQTANVLTGCAILADSVVKADNPDGDFEVILDKLTYGSSIDVCNFDVSVNGLAAIPLDSAFAGADDVPKFRVDDYDDDNLQVVIEAGNIAMGDVSDNFIYRIKVNLYNTFLDRINDCEPEINCRDVE